jgi:hypothetical protein
MQNPSVLHGKAKKQDIPMKRISAMIVLVGITALLGSSRPIQAGEQPESVSLTWTFKGREFTWSTRFRAEDLAYYRDRDRAPTVDYSVYAADRMDDKYIEQLVGLFRELARKYDMSDLETIAFIVSFVQSLPYTQDNLTSPYDEYPRFPLETLIEGGGDCEDSAILTATLLKELGQDVMLIRLGGHMAVGVACDECDGTYYATVGRRYYYIETTGTGWGIGQIPPQYEYQEARLFPLAPQPVIDVDVKYQLIHSTLSHNTYEIAVSVKNEGSRAAKNLKVWHAFGAVEEGKVYSQALSDANYLKPREEITSIVTLSVPRKVNTRVLVAVFGDNLDGRRIESEWIATH